MPVSIIERFGGMLGSVAQSQRTPPPVDAAVDTLEPESEPDLIERVAARRAERSGFAPDTDFPDSAAAASPAAPARRTLRSFDIDLERLRSHSILTPDGKRSAIGEGFRRVKRHILANIASAEPNAPANLVMMTSPLAHEGKTFCAINLAISLAMEMDRTVLLVDADVAKPSLPGVLGFDKANQGLMDVLLHRDAELADVLCKTNIEKLTILPAGKGSHHATEVLGSDAMRGMLQEMAERYGDRIIVFDSPPLLAASEASALAAGMGQIVMVVESGKTTEGALKDALARIESCRVVGLLLNKVDGPGLGYGGYGYGYGYGYGS